MEPVLKIIDKDIHAYTFDAYGISIIAFRTNFEIVYEPLQRLSIHQVGQSFNYRYLVNGSFFEGSGEHAGWLSIAGNNFVPSKQDRQLTHIAILDTRTGEMAFKLAELAWMREKIGEWPILLLDEMVAELDAERRAYLLDRIDGVTQTLATTTELDIFTESFLNRATVWHVTDGQIDTGKAKQNGNL